MNPAPPSIRKQFLLTMLLALFILVAVGYISFHRHHTNAPATSPVKQAMVSITANGFVPVTLSIKQGTMVIWKNTDNTPHVVASNPYPTDNSLPGLHSSTIPPGGSYAYTPAAIGTIQYHDNLTPVHNGTVTVEK
jgi:plastocyanin